jgi:hypothetical protein
MEDKEKENILRDFQRKLIEEQRDIDPDIAQAVNENFWDLIDGTKDSKNSEGRSS